MTDYEKKTDEELIMDFRGGDTAIMDYLLEKYKPMVKKKAKAMYLLGGDSDDLIQEGMIGLFKAVRDYDSAQEASFGTFAQICVTRQLYSAIRASRRKKHLPLNSYISLYDNEEISEEKESELIQIQNIASTNNPEDLVIHKESEDSFMNELEGNLSELERKVLYLHLLGTDYRTIAKLLGNEPEGCGQCAATDQNKSGRAADFYLKIVQTAKNHSVSKNRFLAVFL